MNRQKNKKKVAMILYNFFPADIRVRREANTLQKNGYQIDIICIKKNDEAEFEKYNGINVYRLINVYNDNSRLSIRNLIIFWIKSFLFLFRKKYDIIHSHDPTGLPPATIYKIFNKKTHFIYDSHEIFPENAKEVVGLPSMLGFFAIELLSSLFFSTIITVAPAMKELLIKRYHPKEGIYLLNSLSQNDVLSIQKIKKSTDFIEIIYAGSIQPHRGYEELIDAVLLLQNEIISNYRIRIIGDGPILANLKERARSKEISSKILSFEGWQEHDTYFKMIGESHIGLSLLHGYTYQQYGIPIKFYEYLFGKLYIIFSDTILSDGEKILQYAKYKEGINASDPKEIAEAVKRAIIIVNSNNNDCLNNRKSESKAKKERFLHNIMWERQSKKLILLYSRLIKN